MMICRPAACLFLILSFLPTLAFAWQGQVVGITDGDTLTVLKDGHDQVKIRLYGIDTPEKGQPWGTRAKQKLSELAYDRLVEVDALDVDRYGRTVARVFVDGVEVAPELIQAGLAWVYTRYCKLPVCEDWERFQEEARGAGVGLWSEGNQVAPWEWRKHH